MLANCNYGKLENVRWHRGLDHWTEPLDLEMNFTLDDSFKTQHEQTMSTRELSCRWFLPKPITR